MSKHQEVIDRAYSLVDFGEDLPSLKKELAAYREAFSLFEEHLESLIGGNKLDLSTEQVIPEHEPTEIVRLIGQYGKDCTDSGRKGYVTDELVVSTMSLVQYIYSLTDGTKSPTLPTQENEVPTKS